MISSNEGMWIGLTDIYSDGNWYWIHSRKDLFFADWNPTQFLGGAIEYYAILSLITKKWYDVPPTYKASILCEI